MGRFINPFTDFGFKFLFGREVEKELLIDFLNDLLVGEHVITDIQFLNSEQQPEVKTEWGLIYDIYCVTDTGERIIVEMQNREQPYFKDRALFYLSRAITQQAKRGVWNFQLDAVYGVFFMNFVMDKDMPSKIRTDIVLSDKGYGEALQQQVPADFYRTAELQQRGGWMWKWFWTLDLYTKAYGYTWPDAFQGSQGRLRATWKVGFQSKYDPGGKSPVWRRMESL